LSKLCAFLGFLMKAGGEFSLRSKLAATVAAVALAIALGVVDYLTGRELVISAFYLLPTLLAAWVAGRWSGLVVGTLCTCVWFLSDLLSGPAYQHPLIPVWNAMMLLVFFVVVVWLLTEFRHSHYQLRKPSSAERLLCKPKWKRRNGSKTCGAPSVCTLAIGQPNRFWRAIPRSAVRSSR
jgi:K+-sensing histidine kinase KdpD